MRERESKGGSGRVWARKQKFEKRDEQTSCVCRFFFFFVEGNCWEDLRMMTMMMMILILILIITMIMIRTAMCEKKRAGERAVVESGRWCLFFFSAGHDDCDNENNDGDDKVTIMRASMRQRVRRHGLAAILAASPKNRYGPFSYLLSLLLLRVRKIKRRTMCHNCWDF